MEMKRFLTWLFQKLKCQRGEAAEDLNAEGLQDGVFLADIDDDEFPIDEPGDDDTPPEDKDKDTPPDDDEPDEKDQEIANLKAEVEKQQKEINRLGYAIRKQPDDDKKDDKKDTPFTLEQLQKLHKEHYDDPDVAFEIMKEMMKLGTEDAKKAADNSAEVRGKQEQIDKLVTTLYPDAKNKESELYRGIQECIDWAYLQDNPLKDTLGLALLFLKDFPQTIQNIRNEIKADFEKQTGQKLEDKAEEARKQSINKNKPSKSGPSSNSDDSAPGLTAKQNETANMLGLKTKKQKERYAKILAGRKATHST